MNTNHVTIGSPCYDHAQSRAIMLGIAEVLRKSIVPLLINDAASDVVRCVNLLLRLSQEIKPSADLQRVLQDAEEVAGKSPLEIARLEEAVLSQLSLDIKMAETKIMEPSASQREFDAEQFEVFLQSHALGGSNTRVIAVRNLSGGRSKITTLVELKGATGLPDQVVVRQDWSAGAVQHTTVVAEFHLLRRIFAAGIKVPQPLLLENSSALGAPFIVVTKAQGRQEGDYFNPPRSEQFAFDFAEQLAKLHQLAVIPFVSDGIPQGPRSPEAMGTTIAEYRKINSSVGLPLYSVGLAFDWMERALHLIDSNPTALVHNDLGPHNMMIAADRQSVSALLDWELAGIDHPAIDLGYCREWVTQTVSWPQFMERYKAAGGRKIDQFTLDFYTLWSTLRVYTLILQARAGVSVGAIRDIDVISAIADAVPRLLARVTKYLAKVIEEYPEI